MRSDDRHDAEREPTTPLERDVTSERTVHDEASQPTVKSAAPAGAAAGALAGATAGLVTGPFGPFGALVGAIVGAIGGGAMGAAGAQAAKTDVEGFTADDDLLYRDVWDAMPDRTADHSYERVRPAFQFGHLAAQHRGFAGRDFTNVEPELRAEWGGELQQRVGAWESVHRYVEAAYSTSRRNGVGVRRDPAVIGSAGSAVDPVERDRARAGLPSVEEPRRADDAARPADSPEGVAGEGNAGEEDEWRQQLWKNDQVGEGHGGRDAVG